MSYSSIAQLRQYLSQVKAGIIEDAQLQVVLDRAYDIVNGALGFTFSAWALVATTQDMRAARGEWLVLPYHQAATVTTVVLVNERGATTETTEAVTDWLEETDGRLFMLGGWDCGGWYRVTARWGYGPAPDRILEIEIECAVNIWRGRDASNWQSDIGVSGDGVVSFNRSMTAAQRSIVYEVRQQYLGVVHG